MSTWPTHKRKSAERKKARKSIARMAEQERQQARRH